MIWDGLKESLIVTGMEAESKEDVFRQLGGILTKEGYTKDSYADALIAREKEYPTGLAVSGYGVAIPHTDAGHVNKTAVAIAVLKKPVTFIQMGTDDEEVNVRLVFMLSIAEPNAHIDGLQKILAVIQDASVLEQLVNAADAQEIMKRINEKEKTL